MVRSRPALALAALLGTHASAEALLSPPGAGGPRNSRAASFVPSSWGGTGGNPSSTSSVMTPFTTMMRTLMRIERPAAFELGAHLHLIPAGGPHPFGQQGNHWGGVGSISVSGSVGVSSQVQGQALTSSQTSLHARGREPFSDFTLRASSSPESDSLAVTGVEGSDGKSSLAEDLKGGDSDNDSDRGGGGDGSSVFSKIWSALVSDVKAYENLKFTGGELISDAASTED